MNLRTISVLEYSIKKLVWEISYNINIKEIKLRLPKL